MWLTKFALLYLYYRIYSKYVVISECADDSQRPYRIAIYCIGVYLFCSWISLLLYNLFICGTGNPADFWTPTMTDHGPEFKCQERFHEFGVAYRIIFSFSLLSDVLCTSPPTNPPLMAVILLPMTSLPKLRVSLSQKLALAAVFALGFFMIAVEVVRFTVLITAIFNFVHMLIWNYIASFTAITLCNLPVLRPLLFKKKYYGTAGDGSYRLKSGNDTNGSRAKPNGSEYELDEGDYPLAHLENQRKSHPGGGVTVSVEASVKISDKSSDTSYRSGGQYESRVISNAV